MTVRQARRILVAGIGNIFLGDDAFGVEVAQRLARRPLPEGVRVVDFGIRGFDLAFALQESDETVILVDALPRGEAPGTLSVLEPDLDQWRDLDESDAPEMAVETHAMDPLKALQLARMMSSQGAGSAGDGASKRVLVVGCEPASLEEDDTGNFGLSPPVQTAVEEAVGLVESLVGRLLSETGSQREAPGE